MKWFGRVFVQGLVVVLPLVLTVVILGWLVRLLERLSDPVFEVLFPPLSGVPGVGILLSVGLIFLAGMLLRVWFVRWLVERFEGLVSVIPLVKSVYGSFKDILRYVTGSGSRDYERVVMVNLGGSEGPRCVGLVTRTDFSDWNEDLDLSDALAVYLPMSYQIGGYTVIVPRDRVEDVDMSLEEGLRFTLTAGLKTSGDPDESFRLPDSPFAGEESGS